MKQHLALGLIALVACSQEVDEAASFETTLTSDVDELAAIASDLAAMVADLGEVEQTLVDGTPGVGDCAWSVEVDGGIRSGTFEVALEAVPCGGEVTGSVGTLTYEVTDAYLSGTYALAGGLTTFSGSGSRDALTDVQARRGARSFVSSWEVEDFTVVTDGTTLTEWSFAIAYDGFGDGSWSGEVSMASDGSLEGELTSPGGGSCTAGGTLDAPSFSCSSGR